MPYGYSPETDAEPVHTHVAPDFLKARDFVRVYTKDEALVVYEGYLKFYFNGYLGVQYAPGYVTEEGEYPDFVVRVDLLDREGYVPALTDDGAFFEEV